MTASGWSGLAIAAAMGWSGPALAPHLPPLSRRPRSAPARGRRSRPRSHLTFDDGPHPGGTPAVLEALEPAGRPRPSSWSASRSTPPGTRPRDRGRRARDRAPRVPASPAAAYASVGACRRLRRASDVIARVTGSSGAALSPALRDLQSRRARARAAPWARRGCGRAGAATGGPTPPGLDRAPRARELSSGDVLLLHDADHYSVPDVACDRRRAPLILAPSSSGGSPAAL